LANRPTLRGGSLADNERATGIRELLDQPGRREGRQRAVYNMLGEDAKIIGLVNGDDNKDKLVARLNKLKEGKNKQKESRKKQNKRKS
tara:strand:- start:124 stop:387 length:264 start_codon:yes stop_codon:yes gene_type:complete